MEAGANITQRDRSFFPSPPLRMIALHALDASFSKHSSTFATKLFAAPAATNSFPRAGRAARILPKSNTISFPSALAALPQHHLSTKRSQVAFPLRSVTELCSCSFPQISLPSRSMQRCSNLAFNRRMTFLRNSAEVMASLSSISPNLAIAVSLHVVRRYDGASRGSHTAFPTSTTRSGEGNESNGPLAEVSRWLTMSRAKSGILRSVIDIRFSLTGGTQCFARSALFPSNTSNDRRGNIVRNGARKSPPTPSTVADVRIFFPNSIGAEERRLRVQKGRG
mmetsp:Transcript_15908/g.35829  ORF Transcript_15908/g.35829 Transcript_15908/m.35829 type:complete len:280 (-) Transcript_15908:716-1555(-)